MSRENYMKFSMDGFRKQLSGDVKELRDSIEKIINDEYYEKDDLVEDINRIITHSNVINCVYESENELFNDITDIEVEHL
jgi:hypothetical protein